MDRERLLALARVAHLTPAAIAAQDPTLGALLTNRLVNRSMKFFAGRLNAPREVRQAISELAHSADAAGSMRPLRTLVAEALTRNGATPELRLAVDAALRENGDSAARNIMGLDVPLAQHPSFRRELAAARLYGFAEATALPAEVAESLVDAGVRLDSSGDEPLDSLVAEGKLRAEEARQVASAMSLYRALDEDVALVAGARKVVPRLRGPEDLVGASADTWRKIVAVSAAVPPAGASQDEYAAVLARKIDELHPARALAKRLSALKDVGAFFADNPDVLALDLAPGSADLPKLRFATDDAARRKHLVSIARSYQGVYKLTKDVETTEKVVAAGYGSALSITRSNVTEFAAKAGLSAAAAAKIHTKAGDVTKAVVGHIGSVVDILKGGFNDIAVGNLLPSVDGFLKALPGYAELFGNQDFCTCRHCKSIYGPAAYFVDLMTFVDEKVSKVHFGGSKADHPLHLKVRRPDLWTLPLTCENTDTFVSTLVIINEVLESYIAREEGVTDLTDRAAVDQAVYRDALQSAIHSFSQPFHLPFERLKTFLGHFARSLRDVARATGLEGDTLARLSVSLSPDEYELVTTPNAELSFLRLLYGVQFAASPGGIAAFDAQLLLQRTGLTRAELGTLIATRYVSDNGSTEITIRGEKRSAESVQNDIERIHGLTLASLDRLHRFVRVWRSTSFTIGELDLVLTQLFAAGFGTDIGREALEAIGHLLDLQKAFSASVEDLLALVAPIPLLPVKSGSASLFDRVFNLKSFVEAGGAYPQPATLVLHPAFAEAPQPTLDPNLPRLQAGARINADELYAHLVGLAGPLGIDLTGTEAQKQFSLTHDHLSLLYRHARLARLLRLSAADLYQTLALAPGVAVGHVATLADLRGLREFHEWRRTTRFSLDDVSVMVRKEPRNRTAYPDPGVVAAAVITETTSKNTLVFAETVFAFVGGVTEEQSRAIVQANAGVIETLPDAKGYRLAAAFDPAAPLMVPPGVQATEVDLRATVLPYHSSTILATLLPGKLGATPSAFAAIVEMLDENLGDPEYGAILRGETQPDRLAALAADALPLARLFVDSKVWTPDRLAFVRTNATLFGIADFRLLTVPAVQSAELFRRLLQPWRDEPLQAPDLAGVLAAFTPPERFAAADQNALAAALGCEVGLSLSLQDTIALASDAVGALFRLVDAVKLAQDLGVGGDMLSLAAATGYDDLSAAADAVYAAFRAKYDDEQEWQAKVEPFHDRILGRKRDGLVAYLLYSAVPELDTKNDLYHYFLLDVELEGCARTSRIVAASGSLQLYVQRVRMNLEETPAGHAEPVHVEPTAIPAEEWEWRKNYRLWEANRKVFLYPENYVEPELRDDKTPLFEELEKELLSGEINDDTVREAYARYMRGFEEVSKLKVAGSYHELNDDQKEDALHLFGATSDDPPVYYYRRVANLRYGATEEGRETSWGAWERINVQIGARRVAPLVHKGRLFLFWVEILTKPHTKTEDGAQQFLGYEHRFTPKHIIRKLDGTWTAPQDVLVTGYGHPFKSTLQPIVADDVVPETGKPLYHSRVHDEAEETYTLSAWSWSRLFPWTLNDKLVLRGADFEILSPLDLHEHKLDEAVDFTLGDDVGVPWVHPLVGLYIQSAGQWGFPSTDILWSERVGDTKARMLHQGVATLPPFENYTYASVVLNRNQYERYKSDYPGHWPIFSNPRWEPQLTDIIDEVFSPRELIRFADETKLDLSAVNGSPQDCVIDLSGQLFHLADGLREDGRYLLRRLNTSVTRSIAHDLFTEGVDHLLQTTTQLGYHESNVPFSVRSNTVANRTSTSSLDYTGSMGVYLREIFFHIPFLIANHLNAQGDHAAAQRWYQYIFDPTANEVIELDSSLSAEEKKRRALDRNWRYREFRGLDLESLRAQLTNQTAIEAYKKDPFNPHAIARLRLTAYQKCIVMKYVDNLLDWGDKLFAADTMESVNEATLLYVMAKEILGPRPAQLGDCKVAASGRTYDGIKNQLADDSEFLLELERMVLGNVQLQAVPGGGLGKVLSKAKAVAVTKKTYHVLAKAVAAPVAESVAERVEALQLVSDDLTPSEMATATSMTFAKAMAAPKAAAASKVSAADMFKGKYQKVTPDALVPSFGLGLLRHLTPVFCVPHNDELLAYWDRVDDRLYKIRNCMNLEGVRRQLALFAPPISPHLLVRAKAAGLSLDAVLAALGSDLPPYRFRFLIERAKAYAAMVQSFGAALLSAIEKRDGEQLARLRNLHQRNVLELTTEIREQEIAIAEQTILGLEQRVAAIEYRRDYYAGLLEMPVNEAEAIQSGSQIAASVTRTAAGIVDTVAAISHLIPQAGSPFAMKYGGLEVGMSSTAWGMVMRNVADGLGDVATASGIIGGYIRRAEGWEHQRMLALHELDGMASQLEAARIRKEIASEQLALHKTGLDQLDELIELYDEKFANVNLYSFLATTLQRLFRDAFNAALGFARLAESAYRFERDEETFVIGGGYWDSSRGGLLAGEQLAADLNRLERRFLETDYRQPEINQSFSLAQLDPAALLELKETGACEFELPEWAFDLYYPGHYKRRIKAARLTIPCIAGPYTNVGAKFSLLTSFVRRKPSLDEELAAVPRTRTLSVATSTAQGDAGVFDFNFRDERYMPFEGAGAVSSWRLELPTTFRPFDYETINDVIVNLSYTALDDGLLRQAVEEVLAAGPGSLVDVLSTQSVPRLFSLRQEFSSAFQRLLNAPMGTPIDVDITERHFPMFLQGRELHVASASLVVNVPPGEPAGDVALMWNGAVVSGLTADPRFGGLVSGDAAASLTGGLKAKHTVALTATGDLDPKKLRDVLLYVEYRLA